MTKPPLTDEEHALVAQILAAGDARAKTRPGVPIGRWRPRGKGLRAAAAAVNRHRGVDKLLDPSSQRRRRVSVRWLARQLAERGETSNVAKSHLDQGNDPTRHSAGTRATRGPEQHS